ncbi:MAG: M23 family metallopeptidase [Ardenticatenales bacterium]|nr:M23 family metallopeptidase [Ardenticatenales bacterium]
MRRSVLMLTLVLLFGVPLVGHASGTAEPSAQECSQREATFAALGRPSAGSLLLARVNPQQAPAVTQVQPDVYVVRYGDTLSRIAARYNISLRTLMDANQLQNSNLIFIGQRLYIPGVTSVPSVVPALPAPLEAAWIEGEVVQGEAAQIWLKATSGTGVTGRLGEQVVPFYPYCNLLWGLVAFDALSDLPGSYSLTLNVRGADGVIRPASVPLMLRAGSYPASPMMRYPSDRQRLLDDKELVRGENQKLNSIFAALPYSTPRWSGAFRLPLDSYVTNVFGYMGTQNGQRVGYHEGIDYRGRVGTPILAPAAGVVVVAETLTLRGGTIYIDHGGGVVTGYFHQSELLVRVGDTVNMGDMIGRVGATGLVTGPHLHWEMRVNGRWVNPNVLVRRSVP